MKVSLYIIGTIWCHSLVWGQEIPDSVTIGYVKATMRKDFAVPMKGIDDVPPGTTVPVLRSRVVRGTRWYQVGYIDKIGWIADFTLKSEETATPALEDIRRALSEKSKPTGAICEMEGVKGFKFGMTRKEARSVKVDWRFQSVEDIAEKMGFTSVEELHQNTNEETISGFLEIHNVAFARYPAKGLLHFVNDSLMMIPYGIELETRNNNKYIVVYFELKSVLEDKYGEPKSKEYLSYPYEKYYPQGDKAGDAISYGKGEYYSIWKCPPENTEIQLHLFGDNNDISLVLRYLDRDYDLSEEEKRKALLKEF